MALLLSPHPSYGPFLGTIINSGVIEGVFRGMSAGSTLGTIVNNAGGTISGGNSGIWNNGHFYDTITNSGLIEGRVAIINQGEIAGTINSIFNLSGGIISGSSTAISNIYTSSIGAINNVGTIAAGSYGIIVGSNSTIININNSGTISGAVTAIKDRGTIDTIINSGLIVGNSALVIGGTIFSALSNTGTISGNINVSQDLSITGHGGTLSGGSIVTNNNSLTFTSVANQVLVDNINVGTNTVTNLGTLVLNSSQSIAGNYNQATSGLLDMNATNFTSHGELIVSGVATLSNDFISLTGALTNETLTIVSGSLGTSYSNVSVSASGYSISTISTIIGSTDDLVVSLVRALPAGCSITNASSSTSNKK